MKLELRAKGVRMTDGLRSFIEKRLGFALGRFGHRVRSVRVLLTDINGPGEARISGATSRQAWVVPGP